MGSYQWRLMVRCLTRGTIAAISMICVLGFPLAASASLGGDLRSVQADKASMKGTERITHARGFTIHEIRALNGIVVREYASRTGRIFAVSWHGPLIPDLRRLLGRYSGRFSKASQTRNNIRPRVRGPLVIQEPGLVVYSGGHMRAYFGKAYLPDKVPKGVTAEEIQ